MTAPLIVALGLLGAGLPSTAFAQHHGDEESTVVAEPVPLEEPRPASRIPGLFENGNVSATWGGRLYNDLGFFSADDGFPGDTEDGFDFRAARLFAGIKLFDTVEGKAEFDFAGKDADFKDVYMKFPSPIGPLTVGHHKQPFSLEEQTSSRFITFMERSSVVQAFSPSRDNGISSGGSLGEDTNWALGLFRRTDDGANGASDGDLVTTGRVTHAFGEGADVVHLGLSASMWAGQDVSFGADPEAHLVDDVISTGTVTSDGVSLYGLEGAWVNGPLSLQGEFIQSSIDEFAGGGDVDLNGFYAFVSWFLTGESRNYKSGKFDRITPNANWDGSGFSGGAWELALRLTAVDFDEATGREVTNLTAGVNWYLNPNARIMLNLLQSNVDDSGAGIDDDMTALMMRFQIDW